MKKGVILFLPVLAAILFGHALTGLSSVGAQNMTVENNMTTSAPNMTNATTGGNMTVGNAIGSDTSESTAKMHLEEGINALKTGDTQAAMTHLNAAKEAMANASGGAIKHFEEGMRALQSGDSKGAIMHLTAADHALG